MTFEGGINQNNDASIDPRECADGYNFELGIDRTFFAPRPPFDLYATAPITTSAVTSILQLVKRDDTETTLVSVGNTVYQVSGATPTFTSVGTITSGSRLREIFWPLADYLIITDLDKATVVKKWDGTTFSTLTTGLGTSLYAKYGAVHNGRVWLFNVKTTTDTPHLMVASAFENPTSYDTSARAPTVTSFATGNEAFYMLTPDLRPINGVTVFYDQLIISTDRGRLYKLTGTNANTYQWVPFYQGSFAVGEEGIVNIGNDVAYMRNGGAIELLSATQQFGDVRSDDISRWIPTLMGGIETGIAVYDQTRQKVYFFIQDGDGFGRVAVLFKDRMASGLSPWSIYRTQHASDFITKCARYIRKPGTTDYYVFFGDATGKIFMLPGIGNGDGETASAIDARRRSRMIEADAINNLMLGVINYRRLKQVQLTSAIRWGEDYGTDNIAVTLKGETSSAGRYFGGNVYFGGNYYFSEGVAFLQFPSSRSFSHAGMGRSFSLELSVENIYTFQVDSVELDVGT